MHSHHRKIFAVVVLLAVLCVATPSARAHSVHAREFEATIQSIRMETRTLVVISAKAKFPREMVWNKSTSFVEDDHFVEAAKLPKGVQVRLYYHSPFFGKPYLTKVVWNSTGR